MTSQETKFKNDCYREVDGFFVWSPRQKIDGYLSAYDLRRMADWLDGLNAEWDKIVKDESMKNLEPYPHTICHDCGVKHGKRWTESTWHQGTCPVCHEVKAVTETRDYGYPDIPGFEEFK